ncbi:MAG TPA: universal stress protein [Solirubrobacteraceae bacterium]|nr:universal stress protein [Solirubrobacteraceae bacterium]
MKTVGSASGASPVADGTMLSHITAGLDGFPEGEDAAALGHTLAEVTGAELMLVAVNPEPLLFLPVGVPWKELRKEAHAMLHRARAEFAPQARTVVETDFSVPRALHRVLRRVRGDLLVMGSSRHGPEGRVRIGQHTRQLLCQFECPLAIAPRGFAKRKQTGLSQIGVGFDDDPESQAALEFAASLAVAAGAELEVDAVVDDRPPLLGWTAGWRHGGTDWDETVEAAVEKRRLDTEAAARATGVSGRVEIKRGQPAQALLELSQKVDLLIVGSRRWGPVSRVLLGSTGEALLHDAACPVVVVPRPAA